MVGLDDEEKEGEMKDIKNIKSINGCPQFEVSKWRNCREWPNF